MMNYFFKKNCIATEKLSLSFAIVQNFAKI